MNVLWAVLASVALTLAIGCQPVNSDNSAQLAEISKKLDSIETMLKQGAGAARAQRPQRPRGPDPKKVYAVPVEGAATKGVAADKAKVTVVKAFEFACPFCERARPTMDQVLEKYGDDVRVVYKHYIVHPGSATIPAQAVCAAHKQGKFAEMEDLIWEKGFKASRNLSKDNMEKLAGELGLDMNRFKSDMDGSCAGEVKKDHAELAKVGVTGTPGFFVNGRFVRGAQPFPVFENLIDEELKKANDRISQGTAVSAYYDEWVMKKGEKKL